MLKVVGIVGSPRKNGNTEFMVKYTLDKIKIITAIILTTIANIHTFFFDCLNSEKYVSEYSLSFSIQLLL